MPGRDPERSILTAVIVVVGSMLDAFLGRALGMDSPGTPSAGWIMSIDRMAVGNRAAA
jgi:hypothetical protein